MGKPAARLGDMHVCPMFTGPVPHVGGPISGPGCPTVLIGGVPAAVMGDMCVCVGPPDTIILGSTGVLIGGKPAARMGDQCAHGGAIVVGCPTVLIGETAGGGGGGLGAMSVEVLLGVAQSLPMLERNKIEFISSMKSAAVDGLKFCKAVITSAKNIINDTAPIDIGIYKFSAYGDKITGKVDSLDAHIDKTGAGIAGGVADVKANIINNPFGNLSVEGKLGAVEASVDTMLTDNQFSYGFKASADLATVSAKAEQTTVYPVPFSDWQVAVTKSVEGGIGPGVGVQAGVQGTYDSDNSLYSIGGNVGGKFVADLNLALKITLGKSEDN